MDIRNLLEKIYDICLHQVYYNYNEKLEHANIIEYISEHLPETNPMYYEIRFAKALAFSDSSQYKKAKIEFTYSLENAKNFRDRMRACHYLAQREFLDGNSQKSYEIALKGYEEFKDLDPQKWPEDAGAYCANVLQRYLQVPLTVFIDVEYLKENHLLGYEMTQEDINDFVKKNVGSTAGKVVTQTFDIDA